MTPDQEITLLTTLARVDETTSHIKERVAEHHEDIKSLENRTNATGKTLVRHRGIGIGVAGVFSALLAVVKLDIWR
jgi:hypothetical protein